MHSRTLVPLLAAGWLVLPGGPARADEWVVDSAVATKLTYNDNLNMQIVNPVSATYFSLAPSAKFSNRTESRDVRFGAGLSANYYLEESKNNVVDYNFDLGSKWKRELNEWSLGAASLRNSTLNSEPTRNSELTSTGVVTARRQRTQNSLSGAWSHIVGDSTQAFVSANGAQVRYERGPGLVDYDNNSMALGINHAWSDRTVLTASYSFLTYETVGSAVEVKTNADSYMLGGNWQYSERLSFGLSAGSQKTHSKQIVSQICFTASLCFPIRPPITIRSESSGSTYAANTNYRFESGNLSASVSRGLTASGTGTLLRTDLGALGYSYQYDEALSLGVGASMAKSRNLDAGTGDTRFSSLSSSLTWRLDRDLAFNAAYTHSTQRAAGQSESAKVNLIVLSLSWDLRPLSTSK